MNPEILLVVMSDGECEDREKPILATFDEDKAEGYIEWCKQQDATFQENYQKLREAEFAYDEMHPYTRIHSDYTLENHPRWEAGLPSHLITEAMRAEREAIFARNRATTEAHQKAFNEWLEKKQSRLNDFLDSIGIVEKDEYLDALANCNDRSQRRYTIKKVKFV